MLLTKTPAEIIKLAGYIDETKELASFLNEYCALDDGFSFSAGLFGIIRLSVDVSGAPRMIEAVMILNRNIDPQELRYTAELLSKPGISEYSPLGDIVEIATTVLYERVVTYMTKQNISETVRQHFRNLSAVFESVPYYELSAGRFDVLKYIAYAELLDIKEYILPIEHELPNSFIEALDYYIKTKNK